MSCFSEEVLIWSTAMNWPTLKPVTVTARHLHLVLFQTRTLALTAAALLSFHYCITLLSLISASAMTAVTQMKFYSLRARTWTISTQGALRNVKTIKEKPAFLLISWAGDLSCWCEGNIFPVMRPFSQTGRPELRQKSIHPIAHTVFMLYTRPVCGDSCLCVTAC